MPAETRSTKPVGVLALTTKFLDDDTESGRFVGYGSVYGNIDQAGDVMAPGCFRKSISDRQSAGSKFPILWQHDSSQPIGVIDSVKEDRTGLEIEVSLNLETACGREAYSLMKQGAVKGLSVGFQIVQRSYDDKGIRTIKEARLWEVSVVTFPCNEAATIQSIKSANEAAATDIQIEDVLDAIEKATLPASVSREDVSFFVSEIKTLVQAARENDDLDRDLSEASTVIDADEDKSDPAVTDNDDEPLSPEDLSKALSLLHSITRKD